MTFHTLTTSVTSTGTFGECRLPPSPPSSATSDDVWSPASEDGPSALSPGGIVCTQSFEWKESYEPATPPIQSSEEEGWQCQLVPTKDMDENGSAWLEAIARFPFARFACVIGQTPCREYYLVVVASSRLHILYDLGLPLCSVPGGNISAYAYAPSVGEINTHGVGEATRRSHVAFAKAAVDCALSTRSMQLAQCLWGAVDKEHERLLIPMAWALLLQGILTARADVVERFAKLCRFLGLLVLEAMPSVSTESVEVVRGRSDEAWMAILDKLLIAKRAICATALSNEDVRKEMHRISLLRAAFERARGETNEPPQRIDGNRTANENLADLGDLLDVDTEPAPLSIGGSDAEDAKKLILKELDVMLDSDPELNNVYGNVPVGFMGQVDRDLPHDLLNNLPFENVSSCLCRLERYTALTDFQKEENMLPLFLHTYAVMGLHHPYMGTWMTSEEGWERYRQMKTRLREAESMDDMALCLMAFVYYGRVLCTEGNATPSHGSFLEDFICHLNDDADNVQRAMWESMVISLRRVAAGVPRMSFNVHVWLLAIQTETPGCVTDWLSDRYWTARLEHSHKESCEKVAEETRALVDAGDGLLTCLNESDQGLGGW